MSDAPENDEDDYFGLFPDQPVPEEPEVEAAPGRHKKRNRLPDPVVEAPPEEPPSESEKPPFVPRQPPIPDFLEPEPGLGPEPEPAGVPAPQPAKQALPKKKSPAKKKTRAPKKKAPAAKKKVPAKKAPAQRKAPPRLPEPTLPPGIGGALKALLVLAWLAIAALGYVVWQQNRKLKDTPGPATQNWKSEDLQAQIETLKSTNGNLDERIAILEGARELQKWANEAIADGHRSALNKLDAYYDDPDIQALQEVANAEIIRVESYFVTTRQFRSFPQEMPYISETDPISSLARIVLDDSHRWSVRARAATLLSEYSRSKVAAEALAKASHTDPNLYVIHEAVLAFAKITGFRSRGAFDSGGVNNWWAKNRADFE